jgi:putative phosphoesterase
MQRIGLISDTHGLLRPQATAFLRGCDHIIHAGDIGSAQILAELATIAPLSAVRGNNDAGAWADTLAVSERLRFGGVCIHVLHDIAAVESAAVAPPTRVVVHGHSHRPRVVEKDGVLYVNPGSAGRRRFSLPISIGELLIDGDHVTARLTEL